MEVHEPTRRRWLAGAAALVGIAAIACQDAPTSPRQTLPTPTVAPHSVRSGEAHSLELFVPAITMGYADNNASFDSSAFFNHTTTARVTVEGGIDEHTDYPAYFKTHTVTANELTIQLRTEAGYVDPLTGSDSGSLIQFWPSYNNTPGNANVAFGTVKAPSRDLSDFTPDSLPHIECGGTHPNPCMTFSGGFTVKIEPLHSNLSTTVDSASYLPGSIATLKVSAESTYLYGKPMSSTKTRSPGHRRAPTTRAAPPGRVVADFRARTPTRSSDRLTGSWARSLTANTNPKQNI